MYLRRSDDERSENRGHRHPSNRGLDTLPPSGVSSATTRSSVGLTSWTAYRPLPFCSDALQCKGHPFLGGWVWWCGHVVLAQAQPTHVSRAYARTAIATRKTSCSLPRASHCPQCHMACSTQEIPQHVVSWLISLTVRNAFIGAASDQPWLPTSRAKSERLWPSHARKGERLKKSRHTCSMPSTYSSSGKSSAPSPNGCSICIAICQRQTSKERKHRQFVGGW